ncbi:unnamed protein product [Malus baccata var. baccata]
MPWYIKFHHIHASYSHELDITTVLIFLFDALGRSHSSKFCVASRLLWYECSQLTIDQRDFTGRHRWVEYAEKSRYNASQVPPEWHGWLHYITDHTGDELLMLKPKRYGIEHKENFTGEGDEFIYHSKGHSLNPGQRDWTRYQPWEPTKKE